MDLHRDLRHEFTMGLQGVRKVLLVQAYFVDTCPPKVPVREESEVPGVQLVNTESRDGVLTAMDAATVAAKAHEDENN